MTTLTPAPTRLSLREMVRVVDSLGLRWYPEWTEIIQCEATEVVVTGGVQASKSTLTALWLLFQPGFLAPGPSLYWIIAKTYALAQKEATFLLEWVGRLDPKLVVRTAIGKDEAWRIEVSNGTVIETRSSQNPERIASDAPDAIAIVEAGQQEPRIRAVTEQRAATMRAPRLYSGTMEDPNVKEQFQWFTDLAQEGREHPTRLLRSFSLPSWTNRAMYPGGADDQVFRDMKEREGFNEYTFMRAYGGVAGGAQFAIYPQIQNDTWALLELPKETQWVTAVGGADYGTSHASALVVVGLSTERIATAGDNREKRFERHVAWVRECWWDGDRRIESGDRGNTSEIKAAHRRLSREYRAFTWMTDPNERFMAQELFAKPVKGGEGSRMARVGMVRTRLTNGTLYFDMDGPGVRELYQEMQRVRLRVMPDGRLTPAREDDDRTAALEDAIEALDTRPPLPPRTATMRTQVSSGKGSFPRV